MRPDESSLEILQIHACRTSQQRRVGRKTRHARPRPRTSCDQRTRGPIHGHAALARLAARFIAAPMRTAHTDRTHDEARRTSVARLLHDSLRVAHLRPRPVLKNSHQQAGDLQTLLTTPALRTPPLAREAVSPHREGPPTIQDGHRLASVSSIVDSVRRQQASCHRPRLALRSARSERFALPGARATPAGQAQPRSHGPPPTPKQEPEDCGGPKPAMQPYSASGLTAPRPAASRHPGPPRLRRNAQQLIASPTGAAIESPITSRVDDKVHIMECRTS